MSFDGWEDEKEIVLNTNNNYYYEGVNKYNNGDNKVNDFDVFEFMNATTHVNRNHNNSTTVERSYSNINSNNGMFGSLSGMFGNIKDKLSQSFKLVNTQQ